MLPGKAQWAPQTWEAACPVVSSPRTAALGKNVTKPNKHTSLCELSRQGLSSPRWAKKQNLQAPRDMPGTLGASLATLSVHPKCPLHAWDILNWTRMKPTLFPSWEPWGFKKDQSCPWTLDLVCSARATRKRGYMPEERPGLSTVTQWSNGKAHTLAGIRFGYIQQQTQNNGISRGERFISFSYKRTLKAGSPYLSWTALHGRR